MIWLETEIYVTYFLKTNLTKFAVIWVSKGRFLNPKKLQNYRNEGKGKEKKKQRGEGKEEKRKKAMAALVVFIIATLADLKGWVL